MKSSFYSKEELLKLGIKQYGDNVSISRKISIYSPEYIEIGNNVRIDDFCILSGRIKIGDNVHISAGVYLYGKSGIEIGDYSGCSAGCKIYSETDDFSGDSMVGAVLPDELKRVKRGKVSIGNFVQLGVDTVVMPGVNVQEGAVTGAKSFVKHDLLSWTVNAGIPTKKIGNRSRELLKLVPDANGKI
ncbi:acyltransferase [Candidatus Saccharibacteria bacterium]|nr:acyltransferase [Candidatus Saccharibacteria bacterium]